MIGEMKQDPGTEAGSFNKSVVATVIGLFRRACMRPQGATAAGAAAYHFFVRFKGAALPRNHRPPPEETGGSGSEDADDDAGAGVVRRFPELSGQPSGRRSGCAPPNGGGAGKFERLLS